jgi:hypothetical protein
MDKIAIDLLLLGAVKDGDASVPTSHDQQFFKIQLKRPADAFDAEHRMRRAADERADVARGYVEYWNPMWLLLRGFMPKVARKVSGPRVGKWQELRDYDLDTATIGRLAGSAVEFAPYVDERDGRPREQVRSSRVRKDPTGGATLIAPKDQSSLDCPSPLHSAAALE